MLISGYNTQEQCTGAHISDEIITIYAEFQSPGGWVNYVNFKIHGFIWMPCIGIWYIQQGYIRKSLRNSSNMSDKYKNR